MRKQIEISDDAFRKSGKHFFHFPLLLAFQPDYIVIHGNDLERLYICGRTRGRKIVQKTGNVLSALVFYGQDISPCSYRIEIVTKIVRIFVTASIRRQLFHKSRFHATKLRPNAAKIGTRRIAHLAVRKNISSDVFFQRLVREYPLRYILYRAYFVGKYGYRLARMSRASEDGRYPQKIAHGKYRARARFFHDFGDVIETFRTAEPVFGKQYRCLMRSVKAKAHFSHIGRRNNG